MGGGRWAMGDGRWAMGGGRWAASDGKRREDGGGGDGEAASERHRKSASRRCAEVSEASEDDPQPFLDALRTLSEPVPDPFRTRCEAVPKPPRSLLEGTPKRSAADSQPARRRPKPARSPPEARSERTRSTSRAPPADPRRRFKPAGRPPAVRIPAGLRPPSTDSVTFFRPHPGDWEVVQIVSTGPAGEGPSVQVRCLWIRGQKISTGCGQIRDPQAGDEVVHRQPTGWGRLSPAITSFSTPLSTVRQRNAPPHRVE